MMMRWRALWTLAWRDTRTTRRRLVLSMSSIAIGVAALVAVDSYSANVVRSIHVQARSLLGADLSVSASRPLPAQVTALLDSLRARGAADTRVTTFSSMALVSGGEGTRLVQVRAMGAGAPYYGVIETSPAGKWKELQSGPFAIVDTSLLVALNANIGDTLSLGYARFAILATLRNVPGDIGIAASLGPRVYIPDRYLGATRLLTFGSRAQYEALVKLPASVNPEALTKAHRDLFDSLQVRARSVADTERSLTRSIEQLGRFLGLVGLIALLLGGTGVASAMRAYMAEKIDTIAILRCLGASGSQVFAIYLIEAAGLGLAGATMGVVLGVAAQMALPHVLGSFIFGLPTDRPATFDATVEMALKAGVTFAQFVMMTPFPGTVDFTRWEKEQAANPTMVGDVPITRYWMIPTEVRPKMFTPHPTMSSDEIRERTQKVWDRFYNWQAIWERSKCTPSLKSRLAFVFLSKLYRQMYAGTGISTDSARRKKAKTWARWTARQCKKLFQAKPMPELASPHWELGPAALRHTAMAGGNESQGPFVVVRND